ncbi:AAA family ATPase [Bradyrhizobium sp. 142]|nr:AAA family ATPase [Bradyrhizobium sp. 142]
MRIRHIEIRNFRGIKSLAWTVSGDLNCIIGSGDACKTTILTALDFALSPRTALAFDDADFFNQVVDDDIVIQVTLAEWDPAVPDIKSFFQESTFARSAAWTRMGPSPSLIRSRRFQSACGSTRASNPSGSP